MVLLCGRHKLASAAKPLDLRLLVRLLLLSLVGWLVPFAPLAVLVEGSLAVLVVPLLLAPFIFLLVVLILLQPSDEAASLGLVAPLLLLLKVLLDFAHIEVLPTSGIKQLLQALLLLRLVILHVVGGCLLDVSHVSLERLLGWRLLLFLGRKGTERIGVKVVLSLVLKLLPSGLLGFVLAGQIDVISLSDAGARGLLIVKLLLRLLWMDGKVKFASAWRRLHFFSFFTRTTHI